MLLDHDDYLPRYVLLTPARASDVRMAHAFELPPAESHPSRRPFAAMLRRIE